MNPTGVKARGLAGVNSGDAVDWRSVFCLPIAANGFLEAKRDCNDQEGTFAFPRDILELVEVG